MPDEGLPSPEVAISDAFPESVPEPHPPKRARTYTVNPEEILCVHVRRGEAVQRIRALHCGYVQRDGKIFAQILYDRDNPEPTKRYQVREDAIEEVMIKPSEIVRVHVYDAEVKDPSWDC